MLSYKDLSNFFGYSLNDPNFKSFLNMSFEDLTDYNVVESSYIVSEEKGIELGFINEDAEFDDDDEIVFNEGNPIFSHYNIYPKAKNDFEEFPFGVTFDNNRDVILKIAGTPTETKQGHSDLLDCDFLVDNYKIGTQVITFDYNSKDETLNFIQIRDNNLQEHLTL